MGLWPFTAPGSQKFPRQTKGRTLRECGKAERVAGVQAKLSESVNQPTKPTAIKNIKIKYPLTPPFQKLTTELLVHMCPRILSRTVALCVTKMSDDIM